MIQIPEKIKKLLDSDDCKKNYKITCGEHIISDYDIVEDSVVFTESVCSSDVIQFKMGESSVFEFEAQIDFKLKKNDQITVDMYIDWEGEDYQIRIGIFYIDKNAIIDKDLGIRKIVAYSKNISELPVNQKILANIDSYNYLGEDFEFDVEQLAELCTLNSDEGFHYDPPIEGTSIFQKWYIDADKDDRFVTDNSNYHYISSEKVKINSEGSAFKFTTFTLGDPAQKYCHFYLESADGTPIQISAVRYKDADTDEYVTIQASSANPYQMYFGAKVYIDDTIEVYPYRGPVYPALPYRKDAVLRVVRISNNNSSDIPSVWCYNTEITAEYSIRGLVGKGDYIFISGDESKRVDFYNLYSGLRNIYTDTSIEHYKYISQEEYDSFCNELYMTKNAIEKSGYILNQPCFNNPVAGVLSIIEVRFKRVGFSYRADYRNKTFTKTDYEATAGGTYGGGSQPGFTMKVRDAKPTQGLVVKLPNGANLGDISVKDLYDFVSEFTGSFIKINRNNEYELKRFDVGNALMPTEKLMPYIVLMPGGVDSTFSNSLVKNGAYNDSDDDYIIKEIRYKVNTGHTVYDLCHRAPDSLEYVGDVVVFKDYPLNYVFNIDVEFKEYGDITIDCPYNGKIYMHFKDSDEWGIQYIINPAPIVIDNMGQHMRFNNVDKIKFEIDEKLTLDRIITISQEKNEIQGEYAVYTFSNKLSDRVIFDLYKAARLVNDLTDRLSKLKFRPCDISLVGHPELEAGDVVEVHVGNDAFAVPVLRRTLTGEQVLTDNISIGE